MVKVRQAQALKQSLSDYAAAAAAQLVKCSLDQLVVEVRQAKVLQHLLGHAAAAAAQSAQPRVWPVMVEVGQAQVL
jgi:hypothetical protein